MTDPTHDDEQRPLDENPARGANDANTEQQASGQETIGASGDAQENPALEKDPEEWVSGADPMTESQKSYLDTLARRAGETLPANLTKAEASEHIDRLRGQQG